MTNSSESGATRPQLYSYLCHFFLKTLFMKFITFCDICVHVSSIPLVSTIPRFVCIVPSCLV